MLATQADLRLSRDWETISLDGSILFLASQFESTIRDMAESFISNIGTKFRQYTDIPESIRNQNLKLIGRLLQDYSKTQYAHISYNQVVQELADCLTKGTPVRLFALGFTFHEHNMNSGQLSELYHRAEIADFWRAVAAFPELKTYLQVNQTDLASRVAREKLDAFMEQRNQIAHRGPNYQTVGDAIVLDYIAFFKVLVPAIADVLETKLATY